jgi:DNA-binding transcriptional LysR family regulator
VFRIGGSATFTRLFLLPALAGLFEQRASVRYVTEIASTEEIERRLHDLTLDFGITCKAPLSRPLETTPLQEWKLVLWVPKSLRLSQLKAADAFARQRLPLVLARKELSELGAASFAEREANLICDSFLEAEAVVESQQVAGLLPDFLAPGKAARCFMRVHPPEIDGLSFRFHLAWNPRLMRLNLHTIRHRDCLAQALGKIVRTS